MKCSHFVTSIEEKKLVSSFLLHLLRDGGELSEKVSISVPDGREWSFVIERSGPSVWLDDGWPQFAAYYSIRPANGLFFKYKGASCFDVYIFKTTLCEIDYPGEEDEDDRSIEILGSEELPKSSAEVNKRRKVPVVKGKNVPHDVSDDDGGDLRSGSSRKGKNKLKPNCDNEQLMNDARALGKAKNPIEAAKMLKPAGPSFTKVMRSHHLHGGGGRYIPLTFLKHLKCPMFDKLQVQVSGGSVHRVKVIERRESGGGYMGKGFTHFVRDNNLKKRDVIVFELIEPESAKLKAWIFHASSFRHGQGPSTRNQGTEEAEA